MKKFIPIFVLVLFVFGCADTGLKLKRIWPTQSSGLILKKHGSDIKKINPPKGFIVTPYEVLQMCSPRKYAIIIYADNTHYYVAKTEAKPKQALKFGEKIDGKTGEITHPHTKNKFSLIHIKKYSKIKK